MPTPLPGAAARAASNLHAAPVEEVFYPSSDGRPMAENMWQADAIMDGAGDLMEARPKALVAADILMYPEEGNNRNSIAPDVLVACGLGTHKRSSYFVWKEGKPPDWVLEVASPGTQVEDRRDKPCRYAEIGVPEYWLFDPKGDAYPRGTPRLHGFKLVDGEYQPLESRLVDGERTIRSEVLGLDVRVDGELLRFRDVATGRDVPHRAENKAAAEREAAQRKAADARAERESARAQQESARAEHEAARAKREAAARSDAEARVSAAEARVAELEAALRRSSPGDPP